MASSDSFTWGSLLQPVGKTMEHYGVDPHLGINKYACCFFCFSLDCLFRREKIS